MEAVKQRRSCRTYQKKPVAADLLGQLETFAASIKNGPFGAPLRFALIAATDQDPQVLKGLGTYGFIKDPAGFIAGAAGAGEKNLEDFGFGMEAIILYATGLGLGSCWLGGSFARSRFAARIQLKEPELLPAVASFGYPAAETRMRALMRSQVKADTRKPWHLLFSRRGHSHPLSEENTGDYALPLAMLRLAPSASNGQPWRVIHDEAGHHFYLQRPAGYKSGKKSLLSLADLPRVDMGIAMCHFQLTAAELGLAGKWEVQRPAHPNADPLLEYVASWRAA